MRIRAAASAVAAVAVLAAILLPAAPASAGDTVFHDPVGDTAARSDLRWARVMNVGSQRLFEVRVGMTEVVTGVALVVYVDRRPADSGPELKMVAYPDSEWALFRVDRWRDRGTEVPGCGRVSYSSSTTRPVAVWHATRTCLKLGTQVRVAIRLVDAGHGTDWLPARRTFTDPVLATA